MKCVRDLALMQLVEFSSLKFIEVYHASLLFWCMSVCVCVCAPCERVFETSASTMKGERERERKITKET